MVVSTQILSLSHFIKPATKTHILRFRMLADTLTKGAGWINGDASCRSDELQSPDTQSFLNVFCQTTLQHFDVTNMEGLLPIALFDAAYDEATQSMNAQRLLKTFL